MTGPRTYYRKADLIPLMKTHRKRPVVVFDLETNGLTPRSSILSCSAIKLVLNGSELSQMTENNTVQDEGPLKRLEIFDRYYFSLEPENLSALRVNGLFRDVIDTYRQGKGWPEFFRNDPAFEEFCEDAGLFVAHNIDFDAQFLPFLRNRDQFCTMKSNTKGKYPKLVELAVLLGIDVNRAELHGSLYDAELTTRVFQKMVGEMLPEIEQGDLLF